jgi:hypothetical protein
MMDRMVAIAHLQNARDLEPSALEIYEIGFCKGVCSRAHEELEVAHGVLFGIVKLFSRADRAETASDVFLD